MPDPRPPDDPEDEDDENAEFDQFEALTKKLLEAKPTADPDEG